MDVLDNYRDYEPEEIKQSLPGGYDPWHPNAVGHAVIACGLEGFLITGGFLSNTGLEAGNDVEHEECRAQ